jgi:cytochrome c biogenesis protein
MSTMPSGLRVTGRLLPNSRLSRHGMSSTHVIACEPLGIRKYSHQVSYEILRQCVGTKRRKRVQSCAEPRKAVDKVRDAPSLADAPKDDRKNDEEVSKKERVQSAQDATVGPSVSNSGVSSGWKKVLRPFANLKLAIAELTAIAALSSIGTVIEQNKSAEFYVQNFPEEGNKVLGFLTYDVVFALQLDHIYSSNYFLILLALLGMSLIACTMTTQLPMVKVAQRWRFRTSEAAYQSLPLAREVENARLADFAKSLIDKNYQIFVKDGSLYAFKGLGGKLAPIGVHASMIFTMLGIVWGILGGFEGSAMIQEGDSAPFSSLLEPSTMLGISPKGSSSSLKVDDFRIQYRPDGSIQQFFSDVSVEDRFGNVVQRQTMSVNKPLRYGGITAYQTDWSMTAMSVSVLGPEKRDLVLPMAPLKGLPGSDGKLYATFLPLEAPSENNKPKGISLLAKDLESVIVYDSKGSFVGVRRPTSKKPITVDGVEVVIQDIIASSGMELKSDPGVPLVYAGFGGICITTVLSYLSHSQAWGVQRGSTLLVGGKTNRALVGFQVELDGMLESLPEYSSE